MFGHKQSIRQIIVPLTIHVFTCLCACRDNIMRLYMKTVYRARVKGIEGLDEDGVEAAVDFLHASSQFYIYMCAYICAQICTNMWQCMHITHIYFKR